MGKEIYAQRYRQLPHLGSKDRLSRHLPMEDCLTRPTLDEVLAKHRAGMLPQAERLYLELVETEPDNPILFHLLGVLAHQTGRKELAVERMSRAVALKPDFPEPHYNMGCVLHELGRLDEAVAAYGRTIALRPDYADAFANLGLALRDQDHIIAAVEALQRAITLRPDHTEALSNLGLIQLKTGRLAEAIALLRRAVASNPRHVKANANLGLALDENGDIEAAAEALEHAMALDPNFTEPLANLVHLRRKLCQWDRFETDNNRMLDQFRQGEFRIPPFIVLHAQGATAADHLAAARRWAAEIKPPDDLIFPHTPRRSDGKIHLGYLSVDLRNHPVGFLVAELMERHDRSRFTITAYSYGEDDGSPMRRRLEAAFDHFVDLRSMDDAAAARRIHADGVDILVDITGYTTGARTAILAARPAPIQASFAVGYPGTLGADFIDYLIADPAVAPWRQQEFFAERIVHLPHSYLPFDTRRTHGDHHPTRAQCGLPEVGVVFCCFHNSFKITPIFFQIWMRVLNAVPGSVLWFLQTTPATADNLRREAKLQGVDPQRLVFAERVGVEEYLARHRLADLYLDVLPYNAHGSALDCLWMGLPLLTCAGETFPGRVAARLVQLSGMPELATSSLNHYEALALELALDRPRLSELRQRLNTARASAPLFQMEAFARHLETAYDRMWQTKIHGKPPEAFAVGSTP